jgi:hypothetical protein
MDEETDDQDQIVNVHVNSKTEEEPDATEQMEEASDEEQTELPKTFAPQPIGPEVDIRPVKKHRSKKWLIIILILLVLLIMVGAGVYYVLNDKTKTAQKDVKVASVSKTTTITTSAVTTLKPADVISAVQAYVATKYPQVMPAGTTLATDQIYFKSSDNAPYWMVSGDKYLYISYFGDGASNLSVYYNWTTGSNSAISARFVGLSNAIIQSLTSQGFTKSTNEVYGSQSVDVAYTDGDVICTASSPNNGSLSSPASVACGQISKYTKSLTSYIQIEPYEAAYAKTQKMYAGDVLSFSDLKAGMNGYQYAEVGLDNAGAEFGGELGLFYKTPTGDWTFFMGTQDAVPCSAFNTQALQYAFAYDNCYDSTKTGDAATTEVVSYYNLQP